jgi:uncharacterized protein
MYRDVRESPDARAAWGRWRATRDELFAAHPQSPIPSADRPGFAGLAYFPYNAGARVLAHIEASVPVGMEITTNAGPPYRFTRFAAASFALNGRAFSLDLYWLEGYGGGVFLPFRDATSGGATYGAGRYLLDTVKGADLGGGEGRLMLDFNFAYHPSCAYDPRWACPLAPPVNRLPVPVLAGERLPS